MNKTKLDVLRKVQESAKRIEYIEKDMCGIIDIGNKRRTQEDSLLMLRNKMYKELELLLVADGIGGLDKGEVASNTIACEILKWFENLKTTDLAYIEDSLNEEIHRVDEMIKTGGTTLVTAIKNENETLVTNVGDSRCYIYDGRLEQVTEDQNLAWADYKYGIYQKDDLRFLKNNNLLNSKIGGEKKILTIDSVLLKNIYDKIILCSDGLTDVLSDYYIEEWIKNNDSRDLRALVDYCLNYYERRENINNSLYNEVIGGKDNISVIMKRIRKE